MMLYKISRDKNTIADSFTRQALTSHLDLDMPPEASCTYDTRDPQCSVIQTLLLVTLPGIWLLTASCC